MPGVFLWVYNTTLKKWIKASCDVYGKIRVSGMEFPDTYPLPAAQVASLKIITDAPDPVISQTDPEELKHIPHGYYATGDVYKPFAVDVDGKLLMLSTPTAHKDTHDPQDGADPLDTAEPVKVGAANAIGTSHSLARADHVHEREHAKYTDAAAKAAAVQAGAITNAVTKAPTHDAVFDVKATADAALPAVDKYTNAEAVDAIEADGNLPVASITFIIDGGGEAITTGIKGALEIPFACTINRVTLLADQAGSIVIDIWKQAYADYPPENAQSITSAAPPTIAGPQMSQDSTLTDWTTAIAAGDCLMFNVDSIATLTWVTLSLKVTKT